LRPAGPYLEKHLEELQKYTKELVDVQMQSRFMAKDIAMRAAERDEWLAVRRRENEKRRVEGLEPLPETDPALKFFQAATDGRGRDHLDSLLYTAQISNYCSSVTKFADQSFGKLFVASAFSHSLGPTRE